MPLPHINVVAWQRADDLFIRLHKLARSAFPPFERYELSAQLRKAAYSVAANIVEGLARRHDKDKLHFLNISEASLAETAYCVHVAERLEYIAASVARDLEREIRQANAPLVGLMRSIRENLQRQSERRVGCDLPAGPTRRSQPTRRPGALRR